MPTGSPHSGISGGIAFEETGPEEAPIVVIIHGALDRMGGMALIARVLHNSHRVLRYDRRGYGKSWPHEGPFSVADQVDDLQRLLNGRQAVLIGHSYGGNVALAGAQRLGDQVIGVSTYETPLSWNSWWPGTTAGAMSLKGGVESAAERFMIGLIGYRRWEALPERTKQARRQEGLALTSELRELRLQAPWNPDNIHAKVLCGCGSEGRQHHQEGAKWLSEHLPNAELVTINGAGHSAPTTHPREFAQQLVEPHLKPSI